MLALLVLTGSNLVSGGSGDGDGMKEGNIYHQQMSSANRTTASSDIVNGEPFDPADACGSHRLYTWLDHSGDIVCKRMLRTHMDTSGAVLYKVVIDLFTDRGNYSGGSCPKQEAGSTLHADFENKGYEVPLIWALSTDAFGQSYLSMPISPLRLYSATSLSRGVVGADTTGHLRVRETDCSSGKEPSKVQRRNAMARLVLQYFQCVKAIKKEGRNLLWSRPPRRAHDSDGIIFVLPVFTSSSLEFDRCENPAEVNSSTISGYMCNETHASQEHSVGDNHNWHSHKGWAYYVGAAVFNIVLLLCVIFVAPLPPLKVMSALLNCLHSIIIKRHQQKVPIHSDFWSSDPSSELHIPVGSKRRPLTPMQHTSRWNEKCQLFSVYTLSTSMPQSLKSTSVWPFLGRITSKFTLYMFLLAVFLLVYVAWPLVHYYYILREVVDSAEIAGVGCDWHGHIDDGQEYPKRSTHKYTLVLGTLQLLLPPAVCLLHIAVEKRQSPNAIITSHMQDSRRRKELRCSTCFKLADGTLKLHPWSKATRLLQHFCLALFTAFFTDLPKMAITAAALMLAKLTARLGIYASVCVVIVTSPVVITVCLAVCAAQMTAVTVCTLYKVAVLALQTVPLLRLSSLIIYGAVWPWFDLEGSLLVLLISAPATYPLILTLSVMFQDIFLYAFFTALGVLTNYGTELLFFISIVTTVCLRLRRQYHSFYEPFQSIQRETVNYCKKSHLEHLETCFTNLIQKATSGKTLSCRSGTSTSQSTATGFKQPRDELADNEIYDSSLIRLVAAQTFLMLSYQHIACYYPEVDSVLEDLPWAWCNCLRAAAKSSLKAVQNRSLPTRRQQHKRGRWKKTTGFRVIKVSKPRRGDSVYEIESVQRPILLSVDTPFQTRHHPSREPLLGLDRVEEREETVDMQSVHSSYAMESPAETSMRSVCNSTNPNSPNGANTLASLSCQCLPWREMEEGLRQYVREKTISSLAYATVQAMFFACIFCMASEFGSLFKPNQVAVRIVSIALPVLDYFWHTGQLGASYALRIKVSSTFNDLIQRESARVTSRLRRGPSRTR